MKLVKNQGLRIFFIPIRDLQHEKHDVICWSEGVFRLWLYDQVPVHACIYAQSTAYLSVEIDFGARKLKAVIDIAVEAAEHHFANSFGGFSFEERTNGAAIMFLSILLVDGLIVA